MKRTLAWLLGVGTLSRHATVYSTDERKDPTVVGAVPKRRKKD